MSIQTELTRITNAKAAIKTAIEGKGVTVPNGTLLDGMAALIDSIEAGGVGGGPADHMGYPVVTGEITFSEDVTSSFLLEFGEGSRLRVKTTSGFLNRPFFIMTNSFANHDDNGAIKIISCPAYAAGSITPTVYAFINAYTADASSWNSTYMKFTNLSWTTTAESINARDGSDRTFTGVTIPCTANLKFKAGYTYRYVVGAPWGYPIDTVEVI